MSSSNHLRQTSRFILSLDTLRSSYAIHRSAWKVNSQKLNFRLTEVLGSWHPAPLESMMRSLREGIEPGRNARDTQRRGTGSAPGKEAKDATGCSLPLGSGYAFLPRDVALLASDHRLRGALWGCGGGRRSCGWRSVGSSGGVPKPPPYSSGR
jgi:hypothetical protein